MMTAVLTRIFGPSNLDLIQDVVQDALVKALEQWPYTGVPRSPGAWLVQAAKHRAIDLLRRRTLLADKAEQLLREWEPSEPPPDDGLGPPAFADDLLSMLFMCCHPAIPREGRVALALRTVAGLSVGEIARAFLAEEATVAQRIVRAKRQIRDQGIAFALPAPGDLPARLGSVLEVLYLWFNEGYLARAGADLVRRDLCEEAIRLVTLLTRHPPTDQPATHALLALLLFQAARFPARIDSEGDLLLLREQDRARWDRRLIHRGFRHLGRSAEGEEASRYHLEAGIAACHAAAASYADTDWAQIVDLYDQLHRQHPTPVVALNRAVALSRLHGPEAGLRALEPLRESPALARYALLPAVLAELWAEAGAPERAAALYRQALRGPCSEPERRYLQRRLARVAG